MEGVACEIGSTSHVYVCAVCVSLVAGAVVQGVSLPVCGRAFSFRRTHAQLNILYCTDPKSRDFGKMTYALLISSTMAAAGKK